MNTVAVIPARYASTRLPGKPLAKDTGKFLIQHVYERVAAARSIDRVIVATDDDRIIEAVNSFAGQAVKTRQDHPSGTDRVAEVAQSLDCDIIINVQGDEPEIEPDALDTLVQTLIDSDHPMATLAVSFDDLIRQGVITDPRDPNRVKIVFSKGRALYFSRYPIPHHRDPASPEPTRYLHLGTYAYRRSFLLELAKLPPTPLERAEQLEQLRVLEHHHAIAVALVSRAAPGIDKPADYRAFVQRYNERSRMTAQTPG